MIGPVGCGMPPAGSTEIAFNEDWSASVQPYFGPAGAFPLTTGSKDAVARVTFTQGSLTIHATGKGQTGASAQKFASLTDKPTKHRVGSRFSFPSVIRLCPVDRDALAHASGLVFHAKYRRKSQ